MNGNDLLYTNRYIPNKIVSKKDVDKNIKSFDNYKNNMLKNKSNVRNLLTRNLFTNDSIPVNKANANPFPPNVNKNSYPILSDSVKDLAEDKYFKWKRTAISVNSTDRRISTAIIPNNYTIDFAKNFENIQKIVLKDFSFSNSIPNINTQNNYIVWGYPNQTDLTESGSDNKLIPTKDSEIFFSNYALINKTDNLKQLIYMYKFPECYISVDEFPIFFKNQLNSNVAHGSKNMYDPDFIELNDPNPNETDGYAPLYNLTRRYIEEPYKSAKSLKNNMLLYCSIDINTHIVNIINRIEEINILAVQTVHEITPATSEFTFGSFTTSPYSLIPDRIYVIVRAGNDLQNLSTTDPYPLIMNNVSSIAGIFSDLINNTCFFNQGIYQDYFGTTNIPEYVSTYRFFDTIKIPNLDGNDVDFLRFELKLSSGNYNSYFFNSSGHIVTTNKEEVIIYNKSLQKAITGGGFRNIYYDSEENDQIKNLQYPIIGRGLPFKLYSNNKQFDSTDYCGTSYLTILDMLSFRNPELNDYTETISLTQPYKFIHSNVDNYVINPFSNILDNNGVENMIRLNNPQFKLNIENYNGKFFFKTFQFVFLRLIPTNDSNAISGQLSRVSNTTNKEIISTYTKEFYINLDNTVTDDRYYVKDTDALFAKIYLKQPYLRTNISNNNEYVQSFDDKPLENLSSMTVVITDPFGEILNLYLDHTFTIEIYEKINVLKDTLIDTRRGDIVTNGIKNIYS